MAQLVYTTKGEEVAKRLWRETMDELSFAKVESIVEELSDKAGKPAK